MIVERLLNHFQRLLNDCEKIVERLLKDCWTMVKWLLHDC